MRYIIFATDEEQQQHEAEASSELAAKLHATAFTADGMSHVTIHDSQRKEPVVLSTDTQQPRMQ